ncbi:MAG TPA: HWE histidine kinase domain-containing protein, partial [Chloroflexota bacterium]
RARVMTFANEDWTLPSPPNDRARQIVDGLGEGFLSVDRDWRITDCNAATARFLDRRRRDLLGRDLWEFASLSGDSPVATVIRRVAKLQAPEEVEITYRRGRRARLLVVRAFPLGVGIGATVRDISQARAAEGRLAQNEARYREVLDGTPAAAWLSRPDGELEFINQAMIDALGRPREALLGNGWLEAIDPEDRASLLAERAEVRASHRSFQYEGRFRRTDGALRIIQLFGRPRFSSKGEFGGHVGMATDVTEAREAQHQQRVLVNELNHRVKNTLATVQSIVRQTLRDADVPRSVEGLVTDRLLALSAAHDVLTRESWGSADLTDIAHQATTPYDELGRIALSGPHARLSPKIAIALSMALHELMTNAIKYGALSNLAGRARLSWVKKGDAILLEWRERGGPATRAPERTGFGHRLLGAVLAGELGQPAELTYAPAGLICRIRAPFVRRTGAPKDAAEMPPGLALERR